MKRMPIPQALEDAFPVVREFPSIGGMFATFWAIDRFIASLESGEIDIDDDGPVMRDWDGTWMDIVPAMRGWCGAFDRIARAARLPLDTSFLMRLGNRLEKGILLDVADVEKAKAISNRCKAIFMGCPTWLRTTAVLDERVAIALDELGLRRAA